MRIQIYSILTVEPGVALILSPPPEFQDEKESDSCSVDTHLSTAVAWREKKFEHFGFCQNFLWY